LNELLLLVVGVLVCLQTKHFIADYLLQPPWIIHGKCHLDHAGGYVHAGIHAVGTIPALLYVGLGLTHLLTIIACEFVVHFVIDHTKALISARSRKGPATGMFWALHGADQFAHQLTYIVIMFVAIRWATTA